MTEISEFVEGVRGELIVSTKQSRGSRARICSLSRMWSAPPVRCLCRPVVAALVGGLVALVGVGCGGATRTVTVTTTQAAPPASTPSAASTQAQTVPAGSPASGVGPPPGPPLPDGAATVSGRYRLKYVDYSPPTYNLNARDYTGDTSTWYAQTVCAGGACTLQLRRALVTGGYHTYALHQQDPTTWGGTFAGFTGTDVYDCTTADPQPVRERVGLHISQTQTLGGIPTAVGFDVYLAQSGRCRTNGTRIQATARWHGIRIGG